MKGPILFGLIGHPVFQSPGQLVYRDIFSELEIDALYLPIDVRKEALESTVQGLKRSFLGFNVTIPHKVASMALVDALDTSAEEAQNLNLAMNTESGLKGYNTDYKALLNSLTSLPEKREINNALIFGTGGTARTAVSVLENNFGTESITVISRDPASAVKKFPEEYAEHIKTGGYDDVEFLHGIDAVFNCTPTGMSGNEGKSVSLPYSMTEMPVIVDFVYSTSKTPIVTWAENHETYVISGNALYAGQAAETVRIAFGKEIDHDFLENIFTKYLGSENE